MKVIPQLIESNRFLESNMKVVGNRRNNKLVNEIYEFLQADREKYYFIYYVQSWIQFPGKLSLGRFASFRRHQLQHKLAKQQVDETAVLISKSPVIYSVHCTWLACRCSIYN